MMQIGDISTEIEENGWCGDAVVGMWTTSFEVTLFFEISVFAHFQKADVKYMWWILIARRL